MNRGIAMVNDPLGLEKKSYIISASRDMRDPKIIYAIIHFEGNEHILPIMHKAKYGCGHTELAFTFREDDDGHWYIIKIMDNKGRVKHWTQKLSDDTRREILDWIEAHSVSNP